VADIISTVAYFLRNNAQLRGEFSRNFHRLLLFFLTLSTNCIIIITNEKDYSDTYRGLWNGEMFHSHRRT